MSIAVTALIQPSRRLSKMVFAMLGLILLVATLIGVGLVGDLPFFARLSLALIVAIVASGLCWYWHVRRIAVSLSISGVGQIRLQRLSENAICDQVELVTLLPASTIWPSLLILHLQNPQGRIEVVSIMRDSVSQETFNALLVACRWLVTRRPENESSQLRQN